ncbi:hypothetical protein [Streptomyces sp. BH055]|uniref:hypothetical protein n=1 Tax=unclassified Streptomyces TaxID=2593676 RepID=UPI003BB619C8
MSISIDLPGIDTLTEQFGPLRTVLTHTGTADVLPEHDAVYSLEILGGKTLRESVVNGETGPVLIIRALEYTDPVEHRTRFAVESWSVLGYRTVDHALRLVIDTEYERQVTEEFKHPTLPMGRERFIGGMATFYDATDVV